MRKSDAAPRLSLTYQDQTQSGDLISRVTSHIESIQSFIASGLLDAVINFVTLAGMLAVMFWIDWRFTLIRFPFHRCSSSWPFTTRG